MSDSNNDKAKAAEKARADAKAKTTNFNKFKKSGDNKFTSGDFKSSQFGADAMESGAGFEAATNLNTDNVGSKAPSNPLNEGTELGAETPDGEETPQQKAGNLAERYKAQYGSDAMEDLKGVGDNAGAANEIYANIRSLEGDEFWGEQDLSNLMSKAGHAETSGVIIGDTLANGGLRVNATLQGGIDFSNIDSQLQEKYGGNSSAAKQNSISQLGSSMLKAGEGDDEPASQKLSKAQSYSQAYEDFRRSGGQVELEAGNLDARDEFMENYSLNLQRRMEPGVANKVGNDDLPALDDNKKSFIAGQVVGKGAGFRQF